MFSFRYHTKKRRAGLNSVAQERLQRSVIVESVSSKFPFQWTEGDNHMVIDVDTKMGVSLRSRTNPWVF